MPGHVAHLAMPASGDPVLEATLVLGQVDARHADGGETQSPRAGGKLGAEGDGIGQWRMAHGV